MRQRPKIFLGLFLAGCLTAAAQQPPNFEEISAELDTLLSLTDALEQRRAIFRMAEQWAEEDPIAAYTVISAGPAGSLRDEIEGSLLLRWMGIDTASALRFVASLEEPPPYLLAESRIRGAVSPWLPVSPGSDLVELFDIAAELSEDLARSVLLQVTRRMARSDPRAAAQLVESLPSEERITTGMSIARDYVAVDAEEALAWARRLHVPEVEQAVVEAMAARDPYGMLSRAVYDDEIDLSLIAMGAIDAQDLDRAQFGSALAQLPPTPPKSQALAMYVQSWLVADQDAVFEWILDSGVELPPEAILLAANRASEDSEFATGYAQRLQGEARSQWIRSVGERYGNEDPVRAIEWLESFRTDPGYLRAVVGIAPRLASSDAPRAARLVETLEGPEAIGATWMVAREWAKGDPVAALRWADGLQGIVRETAIRLVIDEWYSDDPARTESWILGSAPGPMREEALVGLVTAVATNAQIPPERLFNAFDTRSARQMAVFFAIGRLLSADRAGARELFETRLTDPALRQRAKTMLDPPALRSNQEATPAGPRPTASGTN